MCKFMCYISTKCVRDKYYNDFSHNTLKLNICSPVLQHALNHVCSTAIIASASGFSLSRMTFRMTALVANKADGLVVMMRLQISFLW